MIQNEVVGKGDIALKTEHSENTTLKEVLKKAIKSPNMPQIFFYSIKQIDRLIKLFFHLTKELNKSINLVLSGTKASIEYIPEEA
ncbi:MAG TPA: hypothetical protein DDZ39_01205 [Flavobacteriaceae bacterium]|nr:hypothetical protein [Flavobacteriaceae bacterium]